MSRFVVTAQIQLASPTNANIQSLVSSIQNRLSGVNVSVNVNVNQNQLRNLNTSMRNINNTTSDAADSLERFGRQSALAVRRYTAFAAATGTFLALGQAIKSSFSEAIDFDKQLNKLRQVTGQSAKDIQSFTKIVTELSTGLGVSSKKLIDVSLVLAQAGLTAKETQKALTVLAKTELSATFEDITDTTEGAIAIINQFGGGVNNLERDLSALNSVSAKFAVESSDLVVAVRRAGGAFQAAGGNLNELLALFTSVRQTTRESAETIATGFRTIFTRLQRTRTVNFLETLGINLRDLEGQFVGPYEAIRRLSTALKNIPSTDPRFAQIIEELGGFRQVSKVIPLIQQFAISEKALGVALRSSNSLSQDAAIAQDSLANKITKVKEEFASLIRQFANSDSIRSFVEISLQLASALIKVASSLEKTLPLITVLGTIGLSRAARSFAGGFASEFGTTRRFARGGIVPGSGNGDTVPAMLTPGEFVMKKSAVQAIGAHRLSKMNKYADGGKVKKSAYVFDFDDTLATTEAKSFADFSNPSFIEGANATRYASLAKLRARKGDDIYVLTARNNSPEINNAIGGFMGKLGISPAGIIGVAQMFGDEREPGTRPGTTRKLTTASKKAKVLSQLAGQYSNLVFLDDNEENVLAASKISGVQSIQVDTNKLAKREKYAKAGLVKKKIVYDDPYATDPLNIVQDYKNYLNSLTDSRFIPDTIEEFASRYGKKDSEKALLAYKNQPIPIDRRTSESRFQTRLENAGKLPQQFLKVAGFYLRDTLNDKNEKIDDDKTVFVNTAKLPDKYKKDKGVLPKEFAVNLKNYTVPPEKQIAFSKSLRPRVEETILAAANALVPPPISLSQGQFGDIVKNIGLEAISGSIFEGALQAITKNIRTGGGGRELLDFADIQKYTPAFKSIFGNIDLSGVNFGDAKFSRSSGNVKSVAEKAVKEYLQNYALKRASGGGVPGHGSGDTVPALLTPGEFVINKKSAQAIGYGNLSRMNRVKKFAVGGRVGTNSALGVAAGANILPLLLSQFSLMNSDMSEFTSQISTAGSNFAVFNELLKNLPNGFNTINSALSRTEDRLNQLSNTTRENQRAIQQNYRARATNNRQITEINNRIARSGGNPSTADSERLQQLREDRRGLILESNNLRNTQTNLNRRTSRLTDLAGRQRASAFSARNLTIGGALASTVALGGGSLLEKFGDANLTSGNFDRAKTQKTLAGGLEGIASGAGIGAALGSIIPGIGTVTGGLIGAAIGGVQGFITAADKSQKEIDKIKFDTTFDDFSKRLQNIASDKLDPRKNINNINANISNIRTRLATASPEDRQTTIGQIDSQIINIETFLTKLAEGSTTFDEFESKGRTAINFFAEFSGQSINQVDEKFKNLIESTQKQAKFSKELADIEARNYQRLRDISNLNAIFSDLALTVNKLNDAQKSYLDFLNGGSFGTGPSTDFTDLFDRPLSISNFDEFARITQNVGSSFGDNNQLANELITSSRLLQDLPNKLVNASVGGLAGGDFETKFFSQFESIPSFLKDSLSQNIRSIIGPESKDENIIKDILANPQKVADELGKSIEGLVSVFKTASPVIKNYLDGVAANLAGIRELQQKLIAGQGKLDEIVTIGERAITEGLGNKFDTNLNISNRRAAIQRQVDLASTRGVGLNSNSIEAATLRISKLDEQISQAFGDINKSTELQKARSDEVAAIEAAKNALEQLADVSGDVADLQEQLSRAGEKRAFQKGIAETLTFGSPEDVRGLADKSFKAIALSQGFRGRNLQTPEVLSFLKEIGDIVLPAFGNKSGNQINNEVLSDNLKALGLSQENIDAILLANEDEKKIVQDIRVRVAQGVAAQTELNNLMKNGIETSLSNIDRNSESILNTITRQMNEAADKAREEVSLRKSAEEGRISSIKNEKANLAILTGGKASFEETVSNIEDIKKLKKSKDDLDLLSKLDITASRKKLTLDIFNANKRRARIDESFGDKQFTEIFRKNTAGFSDEGKKQFASAFNEFINKSITNKNRAINSTDEAKFLETFSKIKSDEIKKNKDNINSLSLALGETFGDANINKILNSLDQINKAIEKIKILEEGGTPVKKAFGGLIPGVGSRDSVPAMLMPGEFVLNKKAVKKYGYEVLHSMNDGSAPQMRTGGEIRARNAALKARMDKRRAEIEKQQSVDRQEYEIRNNLHPDIVNSYNREKIKERRNIYLPGSGTAAVHMPQLMGGGIGIRSKDRKFGGYWDYTSALDDEEKTRYTVETRLDANNNLIEQETVAAFLARKKAEREKAIKDAPINAQKSLDAEKLNKDAEYTRIRIQEKQDEQAAITKAKIDKASAPRVAQVAADNAALRKGGQLNRDAVLTKKVIQSNRDNGLSTYGARKPGESPESFRPNNTSPKPRAVNKQYEEMLQRNRDAYKARQEAAARPRELARGVVNPPIGGLTKPQTNNAINGAINNFGAASENLVQGLNSFPREISLNGKHTVEVIFNGAEVLGTMVDKTAELVVSAAAAQLNKLISEKFPDVGPIETPTTTKDKK